jgi:hypothetical protein
MKQRLMRPRIVVLLVGPAIMACATTQSGQRGQSPGSEVQDLTAAVVRSIADSVRVPLKIDPLPLASDLDIVVGDSNATKRTDAPVEQRLGGVVEIALRAADSSVRSACAGTMVVDYPTSRHTGCPKERYALGVIGTPRRGPPMRTSRTAKNLAEDRDPNLWSVRVLLAAIGPFGFNVTVYDYVFRLRNGREFIERVGLLIVE